MVMQKPRCWSFRRITSRKRRIKNIPY